MIVIGAGPSGILSCKYLKDQADIKCFDGNNGIGGVWLPPK